MKTHIRTAGLTSLAILFLLGGVTSAFADQQYYYGHSYQTQTLNATTTGGVTNLGTQMYHVNGGQVAFAMIAGLPVDPTTATIQYNFFATQNGLSTRGSLSIHFTGNTASGPVSVSGTFGINNIVPAAELPYGCSTSCTSALPFFFLASSSNVQMTVGGSTQTIAETMQVESPYFNPFGAPIVLASTDNSIIIAATYTLGSIVWAGTQVGGTIVGTLNSTQVSGSFSMTTLEFENLVTGTTTDMGTIQFSSMTPSSLNAKGYYTGTSTIPTTGTWDCSATTGMLGTCTETGFQSVGKFTMGGISGSYSSTWGVPALGCSSSMSATVSNNSQQDG
jgi:hypothetical protein